MAFRKSPAKLSGEALWDYALRVLARRPHSTGELKQKLARRANEKTDVAATLQKLGEYGLADDAKFSEAYAASRLQNQGFGSQRVLRDLRAKRVASQTAEEATRKIFDNTSEDILIRDFLLRKYRGKDLPKFLGDEKNLSSVYRRLRVSGFSSSGSLSALRRYKADIPEVEENQEEEGEPDSLDS